MRCRTQIETRYSFNVCLGLFCVQAGDFTVSHPNSCGNTQWSARDFSDIRKVSSNFLIVWILDQQSFAGAPMWTFVVDKVDR